MFGRNTAPQYPEPITPELNERANLLLVNNVARYPQHWESRFITAEAVLQEMDPNAEARRLTGIGILELAQVTPDPATVAPVVHKVHERFGIKHPDGTTIRISDSQIRNSVKTGARLALNEVLAASFMGAHLLGMPEPAELGPTTNGVPTGKIPIKQGTKVAIEMHELLQDKPELLELALRSIGQRAVVARMGSRAQQAKASKQSVVRVKQPRWRRRTNH